MTSDDGSDEPDLKGEKNDQNDQSAVTGCRKEATESEGGKRGRSGDGLSVQRQTTHQPLTSKRQRNEGTRYEFGDDEMNGVMTRN